LKEGSQQSQWRGGQGFWDFPLLPESGSTRAGEVDAVSLGLTLFSLTFIVLICGLIFLFVRRYHYSRAAHRGIPSGRTVRYEMVWAGVPTVIALGLFGWAANGYVALTQPPEEAMPVWVVGKQWMWKVQHQDGPREINTVHVPVGRPVKLTMTSQDVIHSFYVPAFRIKHDVLPDRYTTIWFTADKPGTYRVYCAEYCGTGHSKMRGRVVAMRPADYQQWLGTGQEVGPRQAAPTPKPKASGSYETFRKFGCHSCHMPDERRRAPRLDGLWGQPTRLENGQTVKVDADYVRESILKPQAKIAAGYGGDEGFSIMPSYRGQMSEQELRQLVGFIRELREGWPGELEMHERSSEPRPEPDNRKD